MSLAHIIIIVVSTSINLSSKLIGNDSHAYYNNNRYNFYNHVNSFDTIG